MGSWRPRANPLSCADRDRVGRAIRAAEETDWQHACGRDARQVQLGETLNLKGLLMDLSGFIPAEQARMGVAIARVNALGALVKLAKQIAKARWVRERSILDHLESVERLFEFHWDQKPIKPLRAKLKEAKKRLRQLTKETKKIDDQVERLGSLLAGWTTAARIKYGWQAYEFFHSRMAAAARQEFDAAPLPPGVVQGYNWRHPRRTKTNDVPESLRNVPGIFHWARQQAVIPRLPSFAWKFVADSLQKMSDAAAAETAELQAEAKTIRDELQGLLAVDWKLLAKKR